MLRMKISSKVLIYFVIISIIPLFVVNFVLLSSARSLLLKSASSRQQTVAESTAESVDNYLAGKINVLFYQSRIYSTEIQNKSNSQLKFAVLIKQDSDLEQVSVLGAKGMEEIIFNKTGQLQNYTDQSRSDAYKAVGFLSGKEYVSSVSYNENSEPQITIAVPILKSKITKDTSASDHVEFGEYNKPEDIQGVIVAKYNISNLWESVLSTKIGVGGYAYVVDGLGNLVAHPDKNFLVKNQKLNNVQSVQDFIHNNIETHETTSETGTQVISTPRKLTQSSWAVIVEEPVSSIYGGILAFIKISTAVILGAVVFSILLSLAFRKQLLDPIKKLSLGAKKFGSGDFSQTITLKSDDELQDLAGTFNNMGYSIKKLVGDLKTKNINLIVEQTKLNSILRSVSDGVIALNQNGEIISINPPAARLIGKQAESLTGKLMSDYFLWVRDGKQFIPNLEKQGLDHYTDLVLPHGDDVSYLDLVVSVLDRKESEVAAIITIHDLTPGRELDVMKLDFVAIAAHELRTPLTVVRGYLNLLNTDAIRQLSIYNIENLQKAIVGTDQLSILINNLLNISRIERGEMEIIISKIDLQRLAKEVVTQQSTTATLREQHIVFNPSASKYVYVPGDSSSLREVLNNLIGNALKFTDTGGTVHVNLLTNKDEVRVEVVDNGPGIPPALRSRLFTKFYRVERSLVAGNRGTGLGLYISKTIMDLHHGKIGLEPNPEKGSTFYFTLPIFDPLKHSELISKEKETVGIHGWIKKNTSSRR